MGDSRMNTTDNAVAASNAPLTYDAIKELAVRLRRPAKTLYALSDACDPFFITPGRRAAAEWFAGIWDGLAPTGPVHLRRLHYALVSSAAPVPKRPGTPGVYSNTDRDWNDLVSAATTARELDLVPAARFVDRRAGEPPYIFEPNDEDSDADVFVHSAIEYPPREDSVIAVSSPTYEFPNLPGLHVTPPRVAEPYVIEIWIEKSTMNDVLVPLARARGVTLVTGMGELSLTHCHQFVERVLEHGRATRILYVSDFDPAGNGMPASSSRPPTATRLWKVLLSRLSRAARTGRAGFVSAAGLSTPITCVMRCAAAAWRPRR
jgi:hypothetical protein